MHTKKSANKIISFLLALIFISTNTVYSSQDALRIPLGFNKEGPNKERLQGVIDTVTKTHDAVVTSIDNLLNGSARIDEINGLLAEIDREANQPGSGNLPYIMVISDYHGEIELFLKYIADAISVKIGKQVKLEHKNFPQESIKEQLNAQGVDIANASIEFYLLGDLLDRGSYGIKCFRAAEELINLGVAKYITGNHDLWTFLNVMGYHLPVYTGYDFYGHVESENLVERHMGEHKSDISWWTEKLAEYNKAQEDLQKKDLLVNGEYVSIKEIRERFKKLFINIREQLSEEEKGLWEDLVGLYFGSTDVYTGFNGVGKMSMQWWQEKQFKINSFIQAARSNASPVALEVWTDLKSHVEAANKTVANRLIQEKEAGKWWWQVFNDINHQNYSSVEWWGKDWSSHAGWGTSVIDELNELEGKKIWNQANYIKNPHLKDLAMFYRQYFTLYQKDQYGNYYTHGWLPVNIETSQISFTYKGVIYEGKSIWSGLEIIQNDVRDFNTPLSQLHEALTLVNSWYSDNTTRIKPEHVGAYVNEVGLGKIYKNIGVRTWFTCHNPLNKLHSQGVGFKVQQGDYLHFSVDKGMSWQKFNDAGGYVLVNANGVILRGFEGPAFNKIIDNPPTMEIKKGEGHDAGYVVKKSWGNELLEKKYFLRIAKIQLIEELDKLKEAAESEYANNVPELLRNIGVFFGLSRKALNTGL